MIFSALLLQKTSLQVLPVRGVILCSQKWSDSTKPRPFWYGLMIIVLDLSLERASFQQFIFVILFSLNRSSISLFLLFFYITHVKYILEFCLFSTEFYIQYSFSDSQLGSFLNFLQFVLLGLCDDVIQFSHHYVFTQILVLRKEWIGQVCYLELEKVDELSFLRFYVSLELIVRCDRSVLSVEFSGYIVDSYIPLESIRGLGLPNFLLCYNCCDIQKYQKTFLKSKGIFFLEAKTMKIDSQSSKFGIKPNDFRQKTNIEQAKDIIIMTKHVVAGVHILCVLLVLWSAGCQEQAQPDPEINLEELQRQQASMKRTACLVLSRYHSNAHKETVEEIVSSLEGENQSKYINKMYAMAVERCLPSISIEEAQLFFSANQMDPTSMFYLLDGFDYGEAAHDLDNLTPSQKGIIKFIKQFDEEMQVRREEREAQETEDSGYGKDEVVSIFGIDINNFGSTAGIIYLLVFGSIVGVGLWWGFSNLNNSSLPKHKKKRRDSKKKL